MLAKELKTLVVTTQEGPLEEMTYRRVRRQMPYYVLFPRLRRRNWYLFWPQTVADFILCLYDPHHGAPYHPFR